MKSLKCTLFSLLLGSQVFGMSESNPRNAANQKLTMMMAKRISVEFLARKKTFSKYLKNPDLLTDQFKNKDDARFYAALRSKMKATPLPIKKMFKDNEYFVKVGHVVMRSSAFSGLRGITFFNDIPFQYERKKTFKENIARLEKFLDDNHLLQKKTSYNLIDLLVSSAYADGGKYGDMLKLHLTAEYAPILSLQVGFSFFKDTEPEFLVKLLGDFNKDVNQFKQDMCSSNTRGWGRTQDSNGVSINRVLSSAAMKVADKLTVGGSLDKKRVFVDLLGKYASTTDDQADDYKCNGDSENDPCGCLLNPFKSHPTIGSHLRISGGSVTLDRVCQTFDEAYRCMEEAYSQSKVVYDRNGGYDSYIPMAVEYEGSSQLGNSAATQ